MEMKYNSFEDLKELSDENKKKEEVEKVMSGLVSRDLYNIIGKDKFENKYSRLTSEELSDSDIQVYVPGQGYKIDYEPMLSCKKTIEKRFQERMNEKYKDDFNLFQKFQDAWLSGYDVKPEIIPAVLEVKNQPKAIVKDVSAPVVAKPVKEKFKEEVQNSYIVPIEAQEDSEIVSTGRSIEDFVLDPPKLNREEFANIPKVKLWDYFKLNFEVEKLYQIGRDIAPRKSKFTQEERKSIFNSKVESIDKAKESVAKYSTIFQNYSKAFEVAKLETHATKEEAEFELFMKEEKLNDLTEDYSPSIVKDAAIIVARDSVKEHRTIVKEEQNVFSYFNLKKSRVDKKVKRMDIANQKLDFTKKGFEGFLAA